MGFAAAVDWSQLLEVVWVSLLAGIGVTVLFSLVVFGSSRAEEARREGTNSTLYGLLAVLSMTSFVAVVVFAISVILSKD